MSWSCLFEREGKVSLENLLRLASAHGELDAFENLFKKSPDEISSLDGDHVELDNNT